MTQTNRDFFEALSQVLLRCWIIGFGLLLFSLGIILLGGAQVADVHYMLFDLSDHEVNLIMYCWLGLLKAGILILFLIPWIAIRLMLNKENASNR